MNNERILIIDTEKNILTTYKAALEDEGYQVDIAQNEENAFGKLSLHSYAIVITEFYLRGTTTLKLIRHIQRETPETYIIMTTANYLPLDTYEEVLEAGVQDYFMKPFPIQNLLFNI